MKITQHQFEIIVAYLNSELSGTDMAAFEQEFLSAADLAEEVKIQKQLSLGFRAIAFKKQLAESSERIKIEENENVGSSTNIFGKYKGWLAVASIFMISALSLYIYQPI